MTIINRRRFLGSLAVSTVSAGVARANVSLPTEHARDKQGNGHDGAWFIARQNRELRGEYIVDFWSKPLCDIGYANHLPPTIVRGALWYDSEACADYKKHQGLDYIDSILTKDGSDRLNDRSLFVEHRGEKETLSKPLFDLVGKKAAIGCNRKTALLALDSLWSAPTDPAWADMLPAFRRCYDRVIGHFHIERRGFHHWKTWLTGRSFDAGHFERLFTMAASQCDAIILTSQSLAENDVHLSTRASTETLIGELLRRLGQALLDEHVLAQIAPGASITEGAMPLRVFALGSAGASVTCPWLQESDLVRQRELVFSSFGKPMFHPLLIATCADERSAETIRSQVAGKTNMNFLTTQASARRPRNGESLEWLEFVTLWPFDPDYGPWPN
jgi:hypothetical protein